MARRILCDPIDRHKTIFRREFGLLRNRPDASLLPPGKVDRTDEVALRRHKQTEKSYEPLAQKADLHLLDDAAPILVPKGTGEFTFGDHLRHLHEHAGDIPATLDEFGRCAHCVRRGWFKLNA